MLSLNEMKRIGAGIGIKVYTKDRVHSSASAARPCVKQIQAKRGPTLRYIGYFETLAQLSEAEFTARITAKFAQRASKL